MMQTKTAELAGGWYPGSERGLAAEVDACVKRADAEYGRLAEEPGGEPTAIVVPHAGLAFSGAVAAAAFLLVRDRLPRVDAFVVFGACHRSNPPRPAIWAEGLWETPLGDIRVDHELAEALIREGAGRADTAPFAGDNSIELQTPFIKRLFPEAAIVPVAMPFLPDGWRLGGLAAEAAKKTDRVAVAVASTDLTHYGAAFGVTPAGTGEPALEWTRRNDERFLDALAAMDLERIVPIARRDGSACGAGAAAAAAGWARARGCRAGRLLAHSNSHLIMPRGVAEHFVGYASLAYEGPAERQLPSGR